MASRSRSLSGGKIQADIHEVEDFSEEAALAEQRYGIEPRAVTSISGGTRNRQEIILGVAFRCGLDKVVIPFIDKGIPKEKLWKEFLKAVEVGRRG